MIHCKVRVSMTMPDALNAVQMVSEGKVPMLIVD